MFVFGYTTAPVFPSTVIEMPYQLRYESPTYTRAARFASPGLTATWNVPAVLLYAPSRHSADRSGE